MRDITNLHLRPFALMCNYFEASRKQKCGQNRGELRLKVVKNCNLKLLEALINDLRLSFWPKQLKDVTKFHLRPFALMFAHF